MVTMKRIGGIRPPAHEVTNRLDRKEHPITKRRRGNASAGGVANVVIDEYLFFQADFGVSAPIS
ncbi:hypothetical protein [Mycolicibacterium sp. CBMA 226]|uniref:hypothetical protein n=1 Tax=Mycolicibacterium sp. CBMA 226 TaxID=2606611 RepID=UPI0014136106|nr:hypothetical protein [Mycolicibacterium sp. CBMA 226]